MLVPMETKGEQMTDLTISPNAVLQILERQLTEEEQRVICQEEELQELRQTNSNLEDRVDRMSIQISSPNPQNQSLFDELDMSSGM